MFEGSKISINQELQELNAKNNQGITLNHLDRICIGNIYIKKVMNFNIN